MSDPAQLERIQEDENAVPTIPPDPADTVGTYANAAVHNAIHTQHHEQSPPVTRHQRPRAGSNASHASHVSIDYFDPAGVNELRRTLSRQVTNEQATARASPRSIGGESEMTLAAGDGPFDFEKLLRSMVRK